MLILFNGKVGLNAQQTAIAIEGDHIIAVGSDAEVLNLETANTEKIDLSGKVIWPGLTDSHLHLEMYSLSLQLVDCETPMREICLQRVSEKARSLPEGAWVLGRGWNQNEWEKGFGSASELDAVSWGHPVFLSDKSLHSAWVNSKTLQMAGIDRQTNDPPAGMIQHNRSGEPTGILFESAVQLVQQIIPDSSLEERLNYLRAGQASLIRYGLTGVTDFDSLSSYESLRRLQQKNALKLHVTKGIPFEKLDWAISEGIHTGDGQGRFHWGSLKLFADGALGPQTAAMIYPYAGSETNRGKLQLTADDVFEAGIKASSHGISLAIHAIGDLATHEVLNGFGMLREYERRNHLPLLKHRIEHLQLLHPDNLKKAAELGITASMQPIHTTSDMFTADKYWGNRSRYAYPFQTLLKNGTSLVFGSDAPVESPNPFWGIHAAVTRRRQDGSPAPEGWQPQERIPLAEALAAYTTGPASLENIPDRSGSLSAGAYADLLILSEDPQKVDSQQLFTIHPECVMINGEWVFQS